MKQDSDGTMTLQEAYSTALQAHQQGDLLRAESIYRQLLAQVPESPAVLNMLGALLLQTSRNNEAAELLMKAVALDDHVAASHLRLGLAYERSGQNAKALDSYQQAIKLDANLAEAYNNAGNVLQKLGRNDEAEACYRNAINIDSGYVDAHVHLGHLLKMQGDNPAAEACYREAIRLEPDNARAYKSLADVKKFSDPEDVDVKAMQRLLGSGHCSDREEMHLHFAFGKVLQDLHEYAQAFEQWRQANLLMRRAIDYDIDEEAKGFDLIKRIFDESFFERHEGLGLRDVSPVFIVSMPRSGSTLTEQILASHSQVFGGGELPLFRDCLNIKGVFPQDFMQLEEAEIGEIGRKYLEKLAEINTANRPVVTDKMLFNFLYIGLIRIIFPRARVIHCFRHPMATCLSIYQSYFSDLKGFAYDLTELGRFYRLYSDLMAHWQRLLPGFIHDLEYESLIAEPESEIRRLLDFCGLPWEPECIAFHEHRRVVKTASATQVRQPLYSSGVDRWRHYQAFLGPLREALGLIEAD